MRVGILIGAPERALRFHRHVLGLPAETARGSQHRLCLEVADIDKSLADLESRPERRNYACPLDTRTGINRRRQLNLFDPDGTRSERMEPVTVDGKPAPSSSLPPPH